MPKGATIIELLISVAIIAILGAVAVAYGSNSITRNELRINQARIVDNLRRAQFQSIAGQEDSVWGVNFSSASFVLFKGATYDAGDANNEVVDLPSSLSLGVISLNGGGNQIVFSRVKGETANYGILTISDATTGATANVTINSVGLIDSD